MARDESLKLRKLFFNPKQRSVHGLLTDGMRNKQLSQRTEPIYSEINLADQSPIEINACLLLLPVGGIRQQPGLDTLAYMDRADSSLAPSTAKHWRLVEHQRCSNDQLDQPVVL